MPPKSVSKRSASPKRSARSASAKRSASPKRSASAKRSAPKSRPVKSPKRTASRSPKRTASRSPKRVARKPAAVKATDKPMRHFKAFDPRLDTVAVSHPDGRTPKQAAKKAFSKIWKAREAKKISIAGKIHFTLQESTRGSARKSFHYVGERVKLNPPKRVTRKDGTVTEYKYDNVIFVDKSAK